MPRSAFCYTDSGQPILVGDQVKCLGPMYRGEVALIKCVHDADSPSYKDANDYGIEVFISAQRGFFFQPVPAVCELQLIHRPKSREELECIVAQCLFHGDVGANLPLLASVRAWLATVPHPEFPAQEY